MRSGHANEQDGRAAVRNGRRDVGRHLVSQRRTGFRDRRSHEKAANDVMEDVEKGVGVDSGAVGYAAVLDPWRNLHE